ncbi:MAG: hypothetical protein DLM59_06865 [Pseudonocardiales bacterium]|nr:MAG: hypothetical protein DLM59_06865 [Pseudonocardiales bacterium]
MGIGGSIFLLVIGAILAFAVHTTVAGIDINIIGFILMAAGILGLILFLVIWGPRNRRGGVVEQRVVVRDDPVDPRY